LAIVVAIGAAVLYGITAAPDIGLVDAAEFALAIATGDVAHPPGFPLYLLVGTLFSWLPTAWALNLMSVVFMALAVAAVYWGAERQLYVALPIQLHRERRHLVAIVVALVFATARAPWTYSGIAEVYALNTFLVAAAWAAATSAVAAHWGPLTDSVKPRAPKLKKVVAKHRELSLVGWRWLTAACVLAALGLANHHATATLLFLPLLAMMLLAFGWVLRRWRFWLVASSSLVGAAALYAYLPWAASRGTGLGWGAIDRWSLLWRHVSGTQYQSFLNVSVGEAFTGAAAFTDNLIWGCGPLVTFVIVVGGIDYWRRYAASRHRQLLVLAPLLLLITTNGLLATQILAPQDRTAYDLPAVMAWCDLAAVGMAMLLDRIPSRQALYVGVITAVVLVGANLIANYRVCDFGSERTARTFVHESLDHLPQGSVVLTAEWNLYAPYLYMRHVEGYRTDLRVIDILLLRRFWYPLYIERTLPELVAVSREPFTDFSARVTAFDLGHPFDSALIQQSYEMLLRRWVDVGIAVGGAYIDWVAQSQPQEREWLLSYSTSVDNLLIRLQSMTAPRVTATLSEKDAANLRYLREKITEKSLTGDLSNLEPRHHPYWKVWSNYQRTVESNLEIVARRDGLDRALLVANDYARWYPEAEYSLTVVRQRLGF